MSAEAFRIESLLTQNYLDFVGEHSLENKDDYIHYIREKQRQIFSGEPTWQVRDPEAEQGVVYDLWYRQTHVGFIEVDGDKADVFLQKNRNKAPEFIDSYSLEDKAYNVLAAKDLLDSHVKALQIIEIAQNLNQTTLEEYEDAIALAKENNQEVFEFVLPDDIYNFDPNSFELKYSEGAQELGKIVYDRDNGCDVYVEFGDKSVDQYKAHDLPHAIHAVRSHE